MASYTNILNHVRQWEGGLVYFPNENQWTNKGIQWNTYKALAPKLLGIANPTVEGLKKLTQAQADKFIEYFWNIATYGNKIKDQAAANAFFQALWGSGTYGIKDLQKYLGVKADGVVGSKTVAAANALTNKAGLFVALEARYRKLAQSSVYAKYLNGWLNRLNDLRNISGIKTSQPTTNKKDSTPKQSGDSGNNSFKWSKIALYGGGIILLAYGLYKLKTR